MTPQLEAIARRFAVDGQPVAATPFEGGHINDSYVLTYRRAGEEARYLLQRINDAVFSSPELVMANVARVTEHIRQKLVSRGVGDVARRVLTLVPTRADDVCHRNDAGSCWRLYRFIENACARQTVETPEHAYHAGRAFGDFQSLLADLPPPRLHETIPDFHNTPLRLEALERAVQADACGRVAAANPEIACALDNRSLAGTLLDAHKRGGIPERVVHNDAKLSNVLFDQSTGDTLCVVDLDTVMPGLALYDFGDMVRSMTCTAAEDERDLARVEVQVPLFEALARGYLESTRAFLTPAERALLVTAGKLITFEQAVRFLTDYLNGDTYYRTQCPDHNLDRCRAQFKLLESITHHEAELRHLVS